jgi:hypothetical protein
MVHPAFRKHCTSYGFYFKWLYVFEVDISVSVYPVVMFILWDGNESNNLIIWTKVLYFALLNNNIFLRLSEGEKAIKVQH